MRSSKLSFGAVLAGILAVSASTWALASTKPASTDSSLKTSLFIAAMLGQWLVSGGLAGFIAGRRGLLHGILVAAVACPLVSALWVGLLSGWRMLSAASYWPVFRDFILFAAPLALLGGCLGALLGRRTEAPSLSRPLTIRLG